MAQPVTLIILFELTTILTAGSHATAKMVEYFDDGTGTEAWRTMDNPDDLEVYDPIGKYSGTSGQRGWAIWRSDIKQYCIFDLDC